MTVWFSIRRRTVGSLLSVLAMLALFGGCSSTESAPAAEPARQLRQRPGTSSSPTTAYVLREAAGMAAEDQRRCEESTPPPTYQHRDSPLRSTPR